MVSLKTIGGIALGAYILLNPGAAHSKDITDVTQEIKQCYSKKYFDLQKNIRDRKKDDCARVQIEFYADKNGNNDGFTTPDEIKPVVLKLEKILVDDLKSKVRKLYPLDLEKKIDAPEPLVTEEKRLPTDKESIDKKIVIEYRSTAKDPAYAKLSISYDGRNFTFLDVENDGKFNNEYDCITDNEIKICGDNLKDTIALVDGKETTNDAYFKEAKNRIVKAFADYLLNAVNNSASYYPVKDGFELYFGDNKYHFIVTDHGNDGVTDTFHVREIGSKDGYILKIDEDDSEAMKQIIDGLLPNAKVKAKK